MFRANDRLIVGIRGSNCTDRSVSSLTDTNGLQVQVSIKTHRCLLLCCEANRAVDFHHLILHGATLLLHGAYTCPCLESLKRAENGSSSAGYIVILEWHDLVDAQPCSKAALPSEEPSAEHLAIIVVAFATSSCVALGTGNPRRASTVLC